MVENEIHKQEPYLDQLAEKLCRVIPSHYQEYQLLCDLLMQNGLDLIVNLLLKDYTATEICVGLKIAQCNGCMLKNSTNTTATSISTSSTTSTTTTTFGNNMNSKRIRSKIMENSLKSEYTMFKLRQELESLTRQNEKMNNQDGNGWWKVWNGRNFSKLLPKMVLQKFNNDPQRMMEKRARIKHALQTWVVALVMARRKEMQKDQSPFKKNGFSDYVTPVSDDDKDFFPSNHFLVRNADWRGMDCDDSNPNIKPGIFDSNLNNRDMNCNGIYGTEPKTGRSYESLYCNATATRQVIMFGDSASSGFHVPPEYLDVDNMTNVGFLLEDEFDWPQKCWSTGWDIKSIGEDGSIYLRMRQRDLCMHRQYQNVGHNGGKIENFAGYQLDGLSMTPQSLPYIGFLAYIGNDVCKDSLSEMTTPQQFEERLMNGLTLLDARSPPNSKLLLIGLVDGRLLWNEMHKRIHPLGVTYEGLYHFLTCSGANPCQTWLTPDEATRNATSQRAAELSQVANKVAQTVKLKNIELGYMDFPLPQMLEYCKQHQIPPYLLIEPFDGFHTSIDFADKIEAKIIWDWLVANKPHWIVPVNAFNTQIQQVFGNQGGF
ncbi:hypothetical protein FDP41_005352 [Naegleria fowleri]|uniref:Saposin B-type domain-containing protein n=1 Tax=Naegleria fowleri TaxID=5763 RepID=A0A6A5BMI2_NAEFO|nr:uncharacterized protein FDP41_005352 [Naegleria fowleri]KAF0975358.1 hypothetical protein FDP41_005352 [Naegleria fowleri]